MGSAGRERADSDGNAADPSAEGPVASLAVMDGDAPTSHFRLEPGIRVRIGRDLTNNVRVNDGSCSRVHCEVFEVRGDWVLRDNRSRNGTLIDGRRIDRDVRLTDGTVFRLGETELQFLLQEPGGRRKSPAPKTHPEISAAATRTQFLPPDSGDGDGKRAAGGNAAESDAAPPKVEIQSEASKSWYDDSRMTSDDPKLTRVFARLFQLASKMAGVQTVQELSRIALDGVLDNTAATFGAVLMLPSTKTGDRRVGRLDIKAFRDVDGLPYLRVAERISDLTLKGDKGIHFIDTREEESLETSDSVRELSVASAACVPVHVADRVAGLIHLYTQDVGTPITEDDFHFAMAVAERFSESLSSLIERKQLGMKLKHAEAATTALRERVRGQTAIVGESPAIETLRKQIDRVAPTDATVLVRGESGVGKELVAEAMHYSSRRSGGPFVCLNCAALSESLLESELFGHEKGSFTGATGKKVGKFEAADGGTLLLDEVGEMSLEIQAKFLRVLEGHPFERVGGSSPISVDVRVVAATNRDLEDAVREGEFRKDLYFRLQVMQLDIPPLRDRVADVPRLAQHFIEKFRAKAGRDVKGLSKAASSKLVSYHWPGNIRELLNTIERAVILCEGELIEPDDIMLSTLDGDAPTPPPDTGGVYVEQSIEDLERAHILRTLDATEWNKTQAAQILGIERSTLDRKLKKYGVSRPES